MLSESLGGRIALVTGGSRGIGRAIALRLAEAGADVALLYAGNQSAAEDTAEAVRALGEDVEDKLAEKGILPRRREGMNESRWIVLDYATVILHVFHPEEREYYNIERLWTDGDNQLIYQPEEAQE